MLSTTTAEKNIIIKREVAIVWGCDPSQVPDEFLHFAQNYCEGLFDAYSRRLDLEAEDLYKAHLDRESILAA